MVRCGPLWYLVRPPKRGQNEDKGHYLGHYAIIYAGFAYYGSEVLYILTDCGLSAKREFVGP